MEVLGEYAYLWSRHTNAIFTADIIRFNDQNVNPNQDKDARCSSISLRCLAI